MSSRWELRGFSTGRNPGWTYSCAEDFIEWLHETQAFNHLTDNVIRGWLKGRLEIDTLGYRRRSYVTYITGVCPKCKGRGWFGRGRPDCPECVAIGKKPVEKIPDWRGGKKFTGQDKRRLIWAEYDLGLLNRKSNQVRYAEAFHQAANYREPYYPAWVNDVQINGNYTDEEKAEYLEQIQTEFTYYPLRPKVRGEWSSWEVQNRSDDPSRDIDRDETVIRLALTFGCTCPITGEYIKPKNINKFVGYPDFSEWLSPLGFRARSIRLGIGYPDFEIEVHPFSRKGIDAIWRAVNRCKKQLNGEVDNNWILAEVMQKHLIKKVA